MREKTSREIIEANEAALIRLEAKINAIMVKLKLPPNLGCMPVVPAKPRKGVKL